MPAPKRTPVVAYLRVSTEKQIEGQGLDIQERAIKAWAASNGSRIVATFRDEGVSGAKDEDEREGLVAALQTIEAGLADGLVVYSLDRLARGLAVQEAILGRVWAISGDRAKAAEHRPTGYRPARVFSVCDGGEVLEDDPDDPMRKAMRQMRGVFSELERGMIRKRMRSGQRAAAARKAKVYGSPAFGFRAAKQRQADGKPLAVWVAADAPRPDGGPSEAATLARIRELHAEGLSLRAMIVVLDEEGHRPKRSDRWHPQSLKRIVDRLGEPVDA